MTRVRYGARTDDERRNREVEATSVGAWAQVLTAVYETDLEVVAAVLPRPLEPGEPLVRVTIATVSIDGMAPFGAGYFGVRARHEGTDGEYPLVMPMTTEQSVIGGRETFGEPKKIGEVTLERDGARVAGRMGRLGVRFAEVRGEVVEILDLPEDRTKTDFYFKFLPSPDGKGFDSEPALVYCYRAESARRHERVEGEVVLAESPFDPVVDLPVRRVVEVTFGERQSRQWAEIVSRVPSEWILPYVHQRYDDLHPVGTR